MSNDNLFGGFLSFLLGLIFFGLFIGLLIFLTQFVLPVIIGAVLIVAAFKMYQHWDNSPARLQAKAHKQSMKVVAALKSATPLVMPTTKDFMTLVGRRLPADLNVGAKTICLDVAGELFDNEMSSLRGIDVPLDANTLDEIRYREQLKRNTHALNNLDHFLEIFEEVVVTALNGYIAFVPLTGDGPLAPAWGLITDKNGAVQALANPFYQVASTDRHPDPVIADSQRYDQFYYLRFQLVSNLNQISEHLLSKAAIQRGELLYPVYYEEDAVDGYLNHTPLYRLLNMEVATQSIPADVRFEHMWICAGSGHGKTQALLNMIWDDFEEVSRGERSVVVIDSQGDLINTLSHLKLFADGEPLDGRLVLIDPTDIEYPVQLNLFSLSDRLAGYEPLEREKLQNAAIELYEFILGSLLGAEMTSKQQTMFRYALRAMLVIPNASIHTFRELFEPNGIEKYAEHIQKLPPTARAFFEKEFSSREFESTNRQVVRRLWSVLESGVFERMFSGQSKFNMFDEMNAGKVILISTAKDLLKQNGTEIFGRFFIALLAQSAQERATLKAADRLPCHVYIDECQDYLDENVSLILEQARKYKVGVSLAHQYVGQLTPKLFDSFAANTAQKFVGGVSAKDARLFSQMMNCEPEFIQNQPKLSFAMHIRNYIPVPRSFSFPAGYVEQQERMSENRFKAIRAVNRQRYAVHIGDLETPNGNPPPPPDDMDTNPSPKW